MDSTQVMTTVIAALVMYLVPLGLLSWLFSKQPGYALIAVVGIAVLYGAAG